MRRIHLDTDLGGDPDDVCALALLLGSPEAEVTGITTVLDRDGERAGCVEVVLGLAERTGITVVSGAAASVTTGQTFGSTATDPRYWSGTPPVRRAKPGAASDLLLTSIEVGATVVTIGPLTNLALLETLRPGSLDEVRVVAMGGWIGTMPAGTPAWGPERDFNFQSDTRAVEIVVGSGADLTLCPIPSIVTTCVSERELPALTRSSAVGGLIARQAVAYGDDTDRAALAAEHPGLPEDLLLFHWDPVTCAVALEWDSCAVATRHVQPAYVNAALRFDETVAGRPIRLLAEVDSERFRSAWHACIEALPSAQG